MIFYYRICGRSGLGPPAYPAERQAWFQNASSWFVQVSRTTKMTPAGLLMHSPAVWNAFAGSLWGDFQAIDFKGYFFPDFNRQTTLLI
jgi:hypothetical protein